jgi:hypothetical protein
MDKEYILELYNNLGGESSFGKYSDFEKLITTDVQYQKDFHSSFGKETLGDFKDFSSLVQKKNSVSTGATPQKASQSKTPTVQPTSVGGKQPQVKPSVSSTGGDKPINVVGRKGVRKNKDGTESTHLMAREYVEGKGWVVFPTLFQNKDGRWVDMSKVKEEKGFGVVYKEALKRGEVYDFGNDEKSAIEFADKGNWKKNTSKTTPSGSSFGEGNNMYGGLNVLPPAPQPSSKRPVKKEEALKTKTLGETLGQTKFDLKSKLNVTSEPLTKKQVVDDLQYNRSVVKTEGLNNVIDKSSKEFDDAVSNTGILNKAESFIRSSWNTAIAAASKLPLIGEEIASASDKMGIIADKNSVEKYFKQADNLFKKQGVKASNQDVYNKAKELKIEEDKRNYIENQDSKFLEGIKNEEYLDPKTGEKTKIKDLLSLNDYNKYKTLDKETIDLSNKVKFNDLELQSIYKDIQETKNVLNHQIIFGNFPGATNIYNKIKSKDGELNNDELNFIKYYEENKEQAFKSPINPNLNSTIDKLNQSLTDYSSKYDNSLKQYYTSLEKYEEKYNDKVDAFEDFDNSKRSYDGVFGKKLTLSAKETVNGVVKMVETLAGLSSEIKTKYNLPAPDLDKYLFNKVFDGYNYYDFKNQIQKEKDLVREDVKEVTDLNSLVNYFSDVSSTQLGQMALPVMAGYGKIAMPLLRQSAVYFSSGFGRGVGEAENYEERLKRGELEQGEIGKVYSTWEKVLHGSLSGTADIIGNLPTAIRFSKGLNNVLQTPSTSSMFWKSFTKKGLEYGKETGIDLGKELGEETLAEWMQNASKVFVLQDPTAKLGDGTIDVLKDTTTFTGLMKVFPLFGKGIVNRISNSNESKLIQEKEKELGYWRNRVNEEGISEDTKKLYNNKALKIESELNSTYEKARKRIAEKPFLLKEVEDVNSQIEEKIKEGYSIKDNNELTDSEKNILLKEKELEYKKLNEKRDNILSDKYNPLSYLPEEESTKLKLEAAEELKAEAIANGIKEEDINIKEEEITKRATANYEKQPKETTAEKPTEEGPTGQENVQDVTSTQGQSNQVVQEEKNKVEELRQQELVELIEQVENAEDFITDGKIDANKIAESDNAKAKEIYDKYDKQIKPLLTDIKTQEDAIQKQSTSEGVLRPEQSEMGLQEMVKRDQEPEVITEEVKSEEEVTKIKSDLDASKERLKNAFDKYKNVNIAFDPKNQLAKDKELVKALLDYAYNNIRLGKYNAVKLIEDLAKDGIEITRDGAKYIFDRASKRVQRDINKTVGVKPKPTEQKRINKAYGIGVATQKVETEKQKDIVKILKDKSKTTKDIKKQISDFIKDNLSNFDPKDINKSQQKALLNALVAVDDVNFEEVLGDVLNVFEGVESKKEENINKAYNKVINKIIKPSFYTVSEGKVKKTKITDKYKQKIKEAIDNFGKINNPTTKQKEDFINEMSDLKNKGVQERKSIDEKIKDDKQRKASRVAIDLLRKNKSVLPETKLDTTNELAVDDAFALGGVIFDGIVYPNTLVGKSKFKDAAGKGSVKVTPYKAFKSVRTDKQLSIKERIKRFLKGSALRNFGLASFNLALKYDKSSAEFIEDNFDAPMRRFATDRIKIKSIFTANRNKFFFDLGIDLKKSKSQLAQYFKGKKEVMFPSKKDGGIFLFINHPTMFKLNGKDVRYSDVIADFDKRMSEEKDQAKKDSILAEKEKFELKYKSFEGLRDEHIVDLFNMIRQPDGLAKFLNNYTEDVALMVANYVNSNPGLRKMADKSIDLYKPVATQMNPILDKLGYDTFNDKKYSKKEDEIAVVNNSNLSQEKKEKKIEKIEKKYRIFNAIYPEGIPEIIPYYPISADTEVSTSDDAKFFEDGATNDYSLVFPNLITRKSGGSLVFGRNGILNKYERITDDVTNFIAGHEIMGLSQELLTGTSGSLLKDKLGENFVELAKSEVLNVLKNKSVGENVSDIFNRKGGSFFKYIYKVQGLQTAGELLIHFKSALFQLAGVSMTYAKNPSALKLIPDLLFTKEGRKQLVMAYNLLNTSQELTDRINHKKDSAEVKILETIDSSNNTDLSFATALVHDSMVLTTYADYLSILLTTPVYINKANEYAKKNQGISKAEALIKTIPSFFADEINTTLQSNDSYYMGSNFKNGLALLLGLGKYVQAPRQLAMLSVNEIADVYNKRKSIADVSGKIFMYSVVGVVLTKLIADSVFGDDEDEEKLSEADKETKRVKQINEVANSLLISSGLGGESLATLKDFYLANERPEILGFTKPKGDLNAFDYFNLIAKNNFKNISVPLRNLDAVLDNREIYSNTDQALAALQFGTGTPLFKLKKQSDYLTALAKQELTFREYWLFLSNQYKITDFKKIENEMERYSKILEISYRKYSDPKNKILNDNFLNNEERKMMSGMSNEEKVSFLENVRLNKIAEDFTLKYQEQMNMLKENKNVSKFFDVRKARFEENMTEEVYKLIENKVKYETGGISEKDAILINKEVKDNVLNSKDEFKVKENLSDSELDKILESVANKVNKKVESDYADTSAKMLKEFTAGKKKARAVYNLYKFAKEKGIENRYMQVISEELDDKTLGELDRIIKEEGL